MKLRFFIYFLFSIFVQTGTAQEYDGDTFVISSSEAGEIATTTYDNFPSICSKIAVEGPVNAADLKAVNKLILRNKIVELHLEKCQILEPKFPHRAFAAPQNPEEGESLLEKVWIPEGVVEIDSCAFYGCFHLREINLPNSLNIIRGYAFYGFCGDSLCIPENVFGMVERAFYGPVPMKKLYMKCTKAPEIRSIVMGGWGLEFFPIYFENYTTPIYIPKGSLKNYETDPWVQFKNFIEIKPEEFPTAGVTALSKDSEDVAICTTSSGEIQINGGEGHYQIYNLQGSLLKNGEFRGNTAVECPPGMYVVKIGNKTQKIILH